MTGIFQGFAFLCKLAVLLLKPLWDYQITILRENVKDSGHSGKTMPSCKWSIEIMRKIMIVQSLTQVALRKKSQYFPALKVNRDPWLLVQVLYHLATVGQGH